ncbi:MAG: hypothetical protein CH6_1091 [Candidatus Kapaibacterium sp.]|nr:MAG: hypothetical protein CH6_1091 [Candidatus Kapabacteria bacterium]
MRFPHFNTLLGLEPTYKELKLIFHPQNLTFCDTIRAYL